MGKIDLPTTEEIPQPRDEVRETWVNQDVLETTPIKQYFELDSLDEGDKNIQTIRDWVKKNHLSPDDMRVELRKLEVKLGQGSPWESRIGRLAQYIGLQMKLDSIYREQDAMEQYGKYRTR